MSEAKKKILYGLAVLTILSFIVMGLLMCRNSVIWGDEEFHTNVAHSMNVNNDYFFRDMIHNNGGRNTEIIYTRGTVITKMTAAIFRLCGEDIFYPRLGVFFFAFLTAALVLIYFKYRMKLGPPELALTTIFILGHSFFFEASFYLRFYSIYNLFVFISFTFFWEAFQAFEAKDKKLYLWLILGAIFALVPSLDDWQKTHVAFIPITVALFIIGKQKKVQDLILSKKNLLWGLVVLAIILAPYLTITFDKIFIKLGTKMGSRPYLGYHHYYWDNIWGLLRYLLSLNVLVVLFFRDIKLKRNYTFPELLFYSGVIFGILIGLYVPHNHIFYTRFFLLSSFIATVGAGTVLWNFNQKLALSFALIFLGNNILLGCVNFYYDRPHISSVIEWLDKNYNPEEEVLIADFDYVWTSRKVYTNSFFSSRGWGQPEMKTFLDLMAKSKGKYVYFFYNNDYEFRENIHRIMFNDERIPTTTISRYLIRHQAGDRLFTAPGTGIIRYSKPDLFKLINAYTPPPSGDRANVFQRTKNFFRGILRIKKKSP